MDANNSAISDGELKEEILKLESSARQYQQEVSLVPIWPYRCHLICHWFYVHHLMDGGYWVVVYSSY